MCSIITAGKDVISPEAQQMLSHEEFLTQIAAQLHSQDLTPNPATRSLPVAPHVFRLQLSEFFLDFGNFRTILREDPLLETSSLLELPFS